MAIATQAQLVSLIHSFVAYIPFPYFQLLKTPNNDLYKQSFSSWGLRGRSHFLVCRTNPVGGDGVGGRGAPNGGKDRSIEKNPPIIGHLFMRGTGRAKLSPPLLVVRGEQERLSFSFLLFFTACITPPFFLSHSPPYSLTLSSTPTATINKHEGDSH